jgi:ATP-dependent Clp protease ATP-binding subunit ClpB
MASIQEQLRPLKARYEHDKSLLDEIRTLKQKLDELKAKAEDAELRADIDLLADLKYYAIPEVEQRIQSLQSQKTIQEQNVTNGEDGSTDNTLLTDTVGPEQIMDVVSRWTGIPVTRLSKTQAERLLDLANSLKKRVVGQFSPPTCQ